MNFTCLNAMLLAAMVAVGAMAAPVLALGTTAKSDPLDPDSLAVEACVYLYPLVLMDITRQMTRGVRDLDDVGHRLDEHRILCRVIISRRAGCLPCTCRRQRKRRLPGRSGNAVGEGRVADVTGLVGPLIEVAARLALGAGESRGQDESDPREAVRAGGHGERFFGRRPGSSRKGRSPGPQFWRGGSAR